VAEHRVLKLELPERSAVAEQHDQANEQEVRERQHGGAMLTRRRTRWDEPGFGAPQADQAFTGPNLSLATNVESGNPVHLVRATLEGFRFDGLHLVEDSWQFARRTRIREWQGSAELGSLV